MLPVLLLLILPLVLTLANVFLCAGDLGAQDGNLVEDIQAFASFTACDGTPAWISWTASILTYVPIALFLLIVFGPMIGGLLANPLAGTIAIVALAITGGITLVVAFGGF